MGDVLLLALASLDLLLHRDEVRKRHYGEDA